MAWIQSFNPRTRVGCDSLRLCALSSHTSFNPRTRVGCDTMSRLFAQFLSVSIHAPVWGATIAVTLFSMMTKFQSTHPCGVRLSAVSSLGETVVSIHAPVWGATSLKPSMSLYVMFQSTHPCGVRRVKCMSILAKMGFNPRTRVGCDIYALAKIENSSVSIHAPVWGATLRVCYCRQLGWFQSTHPCGVRLNNA